MGQAFGLIGLWEVAWNLARPAPKIPLNVEIGPNRSFGWIRSDLDGFKRIKDVLGGTVNDVSLAVTAGAVAILSYNGSMFFGLLADRATVEDLETIADYIDDAIGELLAAAEIASRGDGNGMAGDRRPRLADRPEGSIGS